ncbi:MAG: hypothetical protein J7539_16195 [Niabella sp.]|nr:hypothetical protein [Niabella sp.]
MRKSYYRICCIFSCAFFLGLVAHGQKKNITDSAYYNRVVTAERNAEMLATLFGLSKEQQQQLKKLEVAYQERLNSLRQMNVASADVSRAIKQTQQWRMAQLQLIFTAPQWLAYAARQQQMEKKAQNKLPPAKGRAVPLKRS